MIPLIALLGNTSISEALQHNERHERSVSTADVKLTDSALAVLADAVNAETGVRGYAATGDSLFLAPFYVTQARIVAERSSLRVAAGVVGDVHQQRSVDATTVKVLGELAQLRSAIRDGDSLRALRSALEQGKATMDLLRRQVADLVEGPAAGHLVQRSKIARLETRIELLNIAGAMAGILAGLAGVALFTSGISRRVVIAAANADRLGEGRTLEAVDVSGDELGRLAGSLVRAEQLLTSRAGELTRARDEALQATQAKTAFLSHTSHELRTPLNSILGFTQLLEMSDLAAEDHDSVQRILGGGRHLLALINELIDVARIESGDLNLSLESVSIVPLIAEISQLFGPLAAERSIVISQHCAHPYLAARADQQRLSQVLVNVLSNAVKYNRQAGTITISCQPDDADQVSVTISDTGPGLAPEDLERIFVPFERLDAARTGIEGTGIGLPLARALTEAMAGSLTASSVLGEGSSFTVTLARAPDVTIVASSHSEPLPPRLLAPTTGGFIRIVYIEDNPANIEVVTRFVRGLPNAAVQSYPSGRAGLEGAVREIPDVILLDLDLGDLHGSRVLHELKADPSTASIPVVILSADASPEVIRRLLASGAVAYLTKPIDLAQLGQLLTSLTTAHDHQPGPQTPTTIP